MLQLFLALVSQPLFSTYFQGGSSQVAIGCFPFQEGFCAVLSQTQGWGGYPQTALEYLDENGMPAGSIEIETGGEPVSCCAFLGGTVVLCVDSPGNTSRLLFHDGTRGWITEFPGEFLGGGVVKADGEELVIAGNDTSGESPIRLATLDPNGTVTMNQVYSGLQLDVADMNYKDEEACILGGREQPGWNHGFALVFPETGIEYSYTPGEGRYLPVSVARAEQGYYVLANASTPENQMVGEIFLLKTTETMEVEWTASISGESWVSGAGITLTGDGVAVAGWSNSIPFSEVDRSDLILCEFSLQGQLLWSVLHGGGTPDYGLGLWNCPDGGFLVSGCTVGDLYDGWVLRTDSTGSLEPQGIATDLSEDIPFVTILASPASNGTLRVDLHGFTMLPATVLLVDMAGRIAGRRNFNGDQVEFPGLPSGVYTVVVNSGETIVSARAAVLGGY